MCVDCWLDVDYCFALLKVVDLNVFVFGWFELFLVVWIVADLLTCFIWLLFRLVWVWLLDLFLVCFAAWCLGFCLLLIGLVIYICYGCFYFDHFS